MVKNGIKRNKKGQFAKGKKGGPGRPKKFQGTGKPFHDFMIAFEELGGLEGLIIWAKQNNTNRSQFYSLLMRTVPKEVVEKLLLPKHSAEPPVRIEYVPAKWHARVKQLERFIVEAGLELPAEATKAKVEAEEEGK